MSHYTGYIQCLLDLATEHSPGSNLKSNNNDGDLESVKDYSLLFVVMKCLTDLCVSCFHFNLSESIIRAVVSRMNLSLPVVSCNQ